MKKKAFIIAVFIMMLSMSFANSVYAMEQKEPAHAAAGDIRYQEDFEVNLTPSEALEPSNQETTVDESSPKINNSSDTKEIPTEHIPVEDIDLSDFRDKMYINEVQNLSAVVIPSNASEQKISYSSSDTSVAKVDYSGKLTAVGKGTCRIYATCDDMSVYYDLWVRVKTEAINVKSNYAVLKLGEQYNLEAKVQPPEASQSLKFKSKDESIATVSANGVITANSVGSTYVIVSNEDTTLQVNIIVNEEGKKSFEQSESNSKNRNNQVDTDELSKQIKNSEENIIKVQGINKISAAVLKELYGTEKMLVVSYDDYDLSIKGTDIINANNEINPLLRFSKTSNGTFLEFTDYGNLPGTISISLKRISDKYKYLYLIDENNNYIKLNDIGNNVVKISSTGKYLITNKKMERFKINVILILGSLGVFLILSLIYIFTKKRYWFW